MEVSGHSRFDRLVPDKRELVPVALEAWVAPGTGLNVVVERKIPVPARNRLQTS